MSKQEIIQIKIDSDLKNKVELLYHNLGTSFPEAIRIFASQSIKEKGFPFVVEDYKVNETSSLGIFSNILYDKEKDSFKMAMIQKHQ